MRFPRSVIACTSVALLLTACGGGSTSSGAPSGDAPEAIASERYGTHAPSIASLVPAAATAHAAAFTLTVNGSRFETTSVVDWNGVPLPTTFVSSSQLTAGVPAADLASAGSAAITVVDPSPRGASGAATFDVSAANPVPSISALSPASATAGSGAFTLTVDGTGFVAASRILFNGIALATTFVSDAQLTASVPATDVAGAGSASVTVSSPTPGGGSSVASALTIGATNPVPVLTAIAPSTVTAGSAAFPITVTGTGFMPDSTVDWSGAILTTTYISATKLSASVPAAYVASSATHPITVNTRTPGGGTSASVTFTVSSANPVPAIASLAPASAAVGAAGLTLTVAGSGFVSGSIVDWNGAALTTTFVSDGQLTAALPAADLAASGTDSVTVRSPAPGGGTSAGSSFSVTAGNPVPTVSSISPTSATAGGAASTLTVNGAAFMSATSVKWNGTALATTYVSASKLTAQLPASDIASAGTASVTTTNPAPGGGTSAAETFTIDSANAVPVVASLAPAAATAGGAAFTLTVNGSGFVTASTVDWNGAALPTTFVSNTKLTAGVSAADIATAASDSVTVVSPAPGGGTSAKATFSASGASSCSATATTFSSTAAVNYGYKSFGNYNVAFDDWGPDGGTLAQWIGSQTCWGVSTTTSKEADNISSYSNSDRGWTNNDTILQTRSTSGYPSAPNWTTLSGLGLLVSDITKVHVKWSMTTPTTPNAGNAVSRWDALMDIYFHTVANPPGSAWYPQIDLQIMQMLMDQPLAGQAADVSGYYAYVMVNHHPFIKTFLGVTYIGVIDVFGPFNQTGGHTITMMPEPTMATNPTTTGLLWGPSTATHDVGGIIAWLSSSNPTDDSGKPIMNGAGTVVTSPVIAPSLYLTAINAGFEIDFGTAPSNNQWSTTDFWVAVQNEADGS
jgi:hypothetical protein